MWLADRKNLWVLNYMLVVRRVAGSVVIVAWSHLRLLILGGWQGKILVEDATFAGLDKVG